MATVPTPVTPVVRLIDGHAVTSTLDLAAYFGKRHDDVIRKIRALDCSLEFTARNFTASTYTDPTGRECPCYLLTRDGFFFVAMGFTGQKAAQFKEDYIAAFNAMEQRPLSLEAYLDKLDHDSLSETIDEAKHCFKRINAHWLAEVYPMLVLVKSPLAPELYDWFNHLSWKLNSLGHLIGSVRPTGKGGRRHG